MKTISLSILSLTGALIPAAALAAAPAEPRVERTAPDRVRISWATLAGIDLYMADRADADVSAARLVSQNDRDGVHDMVVPADQRPFFLLRDHKGGETVRVAERVLPLAQGSNFRDIGGYPAAGGRHVRWGMIYRSGATPVLTDSDLRMVDALRLANMVDLRSSEERQLAPSRIAGVPYSAVGYSMKAIATAMTPATNVAKAPTNGGALYRHMPEMLAPQMRLLFARLKAAEGPLVYNCSAGQDRTGFATALILSALGVPRETIIADYHLSTQYRRPANETTAFDPAAFPDNAAAKMFSQYRGQKPTPLKEADGTAFLTYALNEVDTRYGSVEAYLDKRLGVSAVDVAGLRATYLE
ncbi:MAG: tyrosine-protein phosphatase [Sphingobium sp.]